MNHSVITYHNYVINPTCTSLAQDSGDNSPPFNCIKIEDPLLNLKYIIIIIY